MYRAILTTNYCEYSMMFHSAVTMKYVTIFLLTFVTLVASTSVSIKQWSGVCPSVYAVFFLI